jgi:chemotaxis protein methyltransferase CheR
MRISDFDLYKDLLKRESGLYLTPDKSYLLDSRLTPVAKKWNYPTLDSMTIALRGVPEPELVSDVVEAMTSNETSFFRNIYPFDMLRDDIVPYMSKNRKKKDTIRIWSAGCSTGQEPFSIAISLFEKGVVNQGWKYQIHATDISNAVLAHGKEGLFSQFEVQRGLPIKLLIKYFTPEGDSWRVNSEIRNMVKFDYFNLLDDASRLGPYDIVFFRNVLKVFDDKTKSKVLNQIAYTLYDDGFLILGDDEKVDGLTNEFREIEGRKGLHVLFENEFEASDFENKAIAS